MAKGIYNETYFKNNPEESSKPGLLYCVVLVDKSTMQRVCLKIGIAKGTNYKHVIKRSSGFKGYEIRIQKVVTGPLEDIYYLEQYLHEKWAHLKYDSKWSFGGHTELFQLDNDIIKSIPDRV